MSIDAHPLRYSKTTIAIEQVLFRRAIQRRLEGFTLETAVEIAALFEGPPTSADITTAPVAGTEQT